MDLFGNVSKLWIIRMATSQARIEVTRTLGRSMMSYYANIVKFITIRFAS
jgi:hypothetical protein